jgi:hypothetical protein
LNIHLRYVDPRICNRCVSEGTPIIGPAVMGELVGVGRSTLVRTR